MKVSIIGLGRVGLPLALFLEDKGIEVIGIDKSEQLNKYLNKKIMPFIEPGCQELLNKSKIKFSNNLNLIKKTEYIFITVGTPIENHFTSNYDQINKCLRDITKNLTKGQTLILRSTIAPGTMKYVKNFIETKTNFKIGKDIGLSFCPERIAENKAIEELGKLPQIIGTEDRYSKESLKKLFKKTNTKKIFFTNYNNSELAKLFNNVHRYVNFAISNQFMILSDLYQGDILKIIKMCNYDYPRGHIPYPGLTAGTCLRKDFILLNEKSANSDLFTSAWKTNEYVAYFLIDKIKNYNIKRKNILILGAAFKKDSDDIRDSLVEKINYYCKLLIPNKLDIYDPLVKNKTLWETNNIKKLNLKNYNIIIIATDHTIFDNLKSKLKNKLIIDVWNFTKKNKIAYINK